MQTNSLEKDAYAEISSSTGSFNTRKNTVKAGTGLLGEHFAFDLRLSKINSDGYVDRASSDLKSFFLSGGYYSKNTIIKANIFSGKEKTYQSWWGVPKVRLENDLEGMMRYEEHYLYSPEETEHMINSDSRTYNYYTYDNETDNYQQDHYQFFYSQKIGDYLHMNAAVHYTYGRGYYEQYRAGDNLADYQLPDLNIISSSDTITTTDLVRQKWLNNDFYGTTFSLNYSNTELDIIFGGACNQYVGRHFGNIIWAQYLSENSKDYEWYLNSGVKTDYNVYFKANYNVTDYLNLFSDIQLRHISHDIKGIDDNNRDITQEHDFNFLNPKLGIILKPSRNQQVYASFAIANREPNRSNFTDTDPDDPAPKPETLRDIEVGYNYKSLMFSVGANIYYMDYKDQLILTGEINDVGSAIMVNVDKSYRRGIEIYGSFQILDNLNWAANATLSQNRIIDFTEHVDDWDTWSQEAYDLGETDIAFSPYLIASNSLVVNPVKNMDLALISKYVSDQFIDNTSSEERKLDAYFVNNVRISYQFSLKEVEKLELSLLINNIFSVEYETNAWVYSYQYDGERYTMDGYFPQAGINFLAGASIRF
jgi:iron complex outermembrane receptor protein